MKELLLFQVGTMQFGIELPLISSIQPMKQIVGEPRQKGRRMTQIVDGRETELYDLLSFFEKETPSAASDTRKLIMVQVEGQPMGMIVDRVDRVVSVENSRIELLPSIFEGPSMLCFPGVLIYEDRLVLLLNPAGIVRVDRHQPEITGTHVKAYDPKEDQAAWQNLAERDGIAQPSSIFDSKV